MIVKLKLMNGTELEFLDVLQINTNRHEIEFVRLETTVSYFQWMIDKFEVKMTSSNEARHVADVEPYLKSL